MKVAKRPLNCDICQSNSFSILYKGLIRIGKFGDLSEIEKSVFRCNNCKAGYLPEGGFDYESISYRNRVDEGTTVEDYWRIHDCEQADRLQLLGSGAIRNANVADIGCGAGSFLDLVAGKANHTIGIEPRKEY